MIVVNDYGLFKDVFAPLNLTNDFIINEYKTIQIKKKVHIKFYGFNVIAFHPDFSFKIFFETFDKVGCT